MSDDESGLDTSRATITVYAPVYQRDKWDEEAEELGLSRSEYLKMMIQAGRKHFDPDNGQKKLTSIGGAETPIPDSDHPSNKFSEDICLESQILEAISRGDYLTWNEIVDTVVDDIERYIDKELDDLRDSNQIRYDGQRGGFTDIPQANE
ncbi:DUF5805 domain-containing protein [Halobellus ruber]|uniref:Uncharacterized protein n=1 Tax=Halobellus ruber TaxID=2761102 RepID=A0A7J9SE91_9EURY|nr:DUF5805 domain-containing protein [Halobellus ruber]MBB6645220.1 hypothetical protein [Halobellus ruber]